MFSQLNDFKMEALGASHYLLGRNQLFLASIENGIQVSSDELTGSQLKDITIHTHENSRKKLDLAQYYSVFMLYRQKK